MKKILVAACLIAIALLVPALASAQGVPGTLIQQSPSELKACGLLTTATGTSAVTATVTVPSGMYAYICLVELSSVANTSAAAGTPTGWTSTNLGGTVFGFCRNDGAALSQGVVACNYIYPFTATPLKSSQPGTNVTIVSTGGATVNERISIYGYIAP